MRGVLHKLAVVVAACVLALCVPAGAFAAPPFSSPVEIARITMESPDEGFTSLAPTLIGGEAAPTAFWGATSAVKRSGARSLWCAGTTLASGASRAYGIYPATTRGTAVRWIPELEDYYASQAEFYYLMPSLGGADLSAFRLMWSAADASGGQVGTSASHGSFPLTKSWARSKTYSLSAPSSPANLSRKPGRIVFSFLDKVETYQTPRSGIGPAVDDVVVSGFVFGPVRDVRASLSQGQGVSLRWTRPARSTRESQDDTRSMTFRIWRSVSGADRWTELTTAGRLTATQYVDPGAVPGVSYEYAIQAWGPGDGDERGQQAIHSYPERPRLTLDAPSTSAYASATLSGALADIRGAAFPAGTRVTVQSSRDNRTFTSIGTAPTRADGSFIFGVRPTVSTYYRVRYAGTGDVGVGVSAAKKVAPAVSLTVPSAPARIVSTGAFSVTGDLKPRHPAGSYPVRIYRDRLSDGGVWQSYAPVLARASNAGAYSKYTASMKLAKGTWRIRAYHPADAQNAATWSAFRYLTVR